MKKMIGSMILAGLMFTSVVAAKEKEYPITLTVTQIGTQVVGTQSTATVSAANRGILGVIAHGKASTVNATAHDTYGTIVVDGKTYAIQLENKKNKSLLAGTYPARVNKEQLTVKTPDGKEITFIVIAEQEVKPDTKTN